MVALDSTCSDRVGAYGGSRNRKGRVRFGAIHFKRILQKWKSPGMKPNNLGKTERHEKSAAPMSRKKPVE